MDWGLNSKVKSSKLLALFYFILFILKIRTEVCKVKKSILNVVFNRYSLSLWRREMLKIFNIINCQWKLKTVKTTNLGKD